MPAGGLGCAQDVVYSSPAYLMIRRLLEAFRYRPNPVADLLVDSDAPAAAGDGDGGLRDRLHRRALALQRGAFHWIRCARTLLHYHRAQAGRRRLGGAGSEARLTESCQQMPTIVPSRSGSAPARFVRG